LTLSVVSVILMTTRSRSWFFTYNNYKKEFLTQFADLLGKLGNYVFQEEKGDCGTIHLQGCLKFKNAVSIKFQAGLPKEIHWERCRNWLKAVTYCTKRLSRIGRVFTNIVGLKWRKKKTDPLEGKTLYPWQTKILEIIASSPDDRTINWFWSEKGCLGKSSMCKHLVMKYDAMLCSGNTRDSTYLIAQREEERDVEIIVFNVVRDSYNQMNYRLMEEIKDGCFVAGKYESKVTIIDPPHIFVFCNMEPKYHKLSPDRWNVVNID